MFRSIIPFILIFKFLQIGIIGGSGLDDPDILEERTERYVVTPFGKVRGSTMRISIKN